MWIRIAQGALGIWLIAAPHVLEYGGRPAANDYVVGFVVAIAAISALSADRSLRWWLALLGVWMLVAPWLLGAPTRALIHQTLAGVALGLLAALQTLASKRRSGRQRSPGAPEPAGAGSAVTNTREIVVITGGTAGVGKSTALRFARDGASVAVLARGSESLEATVRDIEACGGRALALQVDVADPEQVFAAAERIERELGPIDVWINNAMTTVFGPVWQLSPAEYRRVTDVTYHGYVWGTQAALARMRARNRGVIVQVGSALAYRSIPLQAAYCGAKHAVRAFTDGLRCELLHEGMDVHLTMVQLPAVNTPQFRQCLNKMPREPQPVPPIFQPEIAADAIHYAAHARKREVYVGHPTIETIIGQKLAPGLLDRFLSHAGWEGQFTEQAASQTRANNLFAPVAGAHGTHGAFDDRARPRDLVTPVSIRLGAAGVRVVVALISPIWAVFVITKRVLASLKRPRGAVA